MCGKRMQASRKTEEIIPIGKAFCCVGRRGKEGGRGNLRDSGQRRRRGRREENRRKQSREKKG